MANILIIDDCLQWWKDLKSEVEGHHRFSILSLDREIAYHLKKQDYDCILLSFEKDQNSFIALKEIRRISCHTPVIAISTLEKAELIVKSVKEGVFDFLVKPFLKEKLLLTIERALEHRHLKNEIDYLRREQDVVYDFDRIIARSSSMKRMIATLKKFARTDSTILITGETGTGKSFLSGAVHFNSIRRTHPFIKINCANLPETLLESELFGHEKGSFTGADKTRVGRLEQANGGTVFLDEIGEMGLPLQAKLLRVLEEKRFERVGGNKTIFSDVRIIAATNRKPESQVVEGRFREDLYYRLNVLRIHLPALRDRKECIEPLANYLLGKICRTLKKKIDGFSAEVIMAFKDYGWPGNIRQLANTIERAAILEDSTEIQIEHVILSDSSKTPPQDTQETPVNTPADSFKPADSLTSLERETILDVLKECLWIQKDAAARLGITPRTLNYKIQKYGITHSRWRKHR